MISRRAFVVGLPFISMMPVTAFSDARRSSLVISGQAIVLINRYRKDNKKTPLGIDPQLEIIALRHAEEMARMGSLNHDNFKKRLSDVQIDLPSAENVAVGQNTVAQVMRAWQRSSQHRRNLLGSYNRFGMAVARNARSGNRPYWAMILSE